MADKKISALTASTTPLAGTEVLPIVQGGSTVKVSVSDLTTGRAVSMSGLTVTGQTASIGPGGTGARNAVFTINGSSASSYGPYVIFQRNSVSQWFVGTDSGINGGTSNDLILYSASNNLRLYNDVRAMNGNFVLSTAGKGIDFSANTHAAGMTSELLNDYEEGTWTPSDGSGAGLSFSVIANTCFYTKVGNLVTCTFALVYPATASASSASITGLPFTAKATGNSVAGGPVTYCDAGFALTQLVSPSATSFGLWNNSGGVVTNLQMSGRSLRGVIQYMV